MHVSPSLMRLNARKSLSHVKERSLPEQIVQPVCILCRSRLAGEVRVKQDYPAPSTISSTTGSYPGANRAGSVAKIDLDLSAVEEMDRKTDAVELQPLHTNEWQASSYESGHDDKQHGLGLEV